MLLLTFKQLIITCVTMSIHYSISKLQLNSLRQQHNKGRTAVIAVAVKAK